MSGCRQSGGDFQAVIDKLKQVSHQHSVEVVQKLEKNPLEIYVVDQEIAQGDYDTAERPAWVDNIPGVVDVMTSQEAKAYVQQWDGQDLTKIEVN